MNAPFFSVIIPTYNSKETLGKAIDSVLNQTYKNFELIIVDDGSIDGTDILVNSYLDSRIKYLHQTNSGGPAKPRNTGIANSRGDWVCLLDADDSWYIKKLEMCLKIINKDVDLIYHDLRIIYENQGWNFKRKLFSKRLSSLVFVDLLIDGNVIPNSSVVVRKKMLEKIGGFSERMDLIAIEDYYAWLKIAKITNKFFYIKEVLGTYYIHSKGLSNKNMAILNEIAVKEFLPELEKNIADKIKARIALIAAKYGVEERKFEIAMKYLKSSLYYGGPLIKIKSTLLMLYGFILFYVNKK